MTGLSINSCTRNSSCLEQSTNATDSASLAREWQYGRRSELAGAQVGTNRFGYAYDTIGNRTWDVASTVTNSYAANSLNQYATILRASVSPCEILPRYDVDGNMTDDGLFSYVDFVRRQSPCVCDS